MLNDIIGNGVHQVSFAESGTAVNVKRVIDFAGLLRYCKSCRMGGIVILADNEIIKGIFLTEKSRGILHRKTCFPLPVILLLLNLSF